MKKKLFYSSLALLSVPLAAAPALADNSFLSLGPGTGVNINPGQSFNMTISLNADIAFAGFDVTLLSSNPSAFTVTSQTLNSASITDPNGSPTFPYTLPTASPAGQAPDWGYGTSSGQNVAAGNYSPIETLSITPAGNLGPGTYTISTLNNGSHFTDIYNASFTSFPLSASYSITVIPEPTTIGLTLVAGGCLLVRRKSRPINIG